MTKAKYKERTIICIGCDKEHTARMPEGRKYCSSECRYTSKRPSRRTGENKLCSQCEIEIYVQKSASRDNNFCSQKCANEYQSRNKIEFECKTCKKLFYWSKSRLKDNNPTYCSIDCRNKDKDWYLNAAIKGNLVQQHKKGLNNLELLGKTILEQLEIEFEEQVLIADKFLVDVLIPKHNLIIQWDGDYWHGHHTKLKNGNPDSRQKKRMALDNSQDEYMKKCGYTVLRFWEHEVKEEITNNNENIKNTIRQFTN
jgi:very-short-patch-repair endonuclease